MPAYGDLVHDTTASTGTGALTLTAVNGKRTFNTAFGSGAPLNVFDYYISHRSAAEWERGTGHLSAATTFVRDTVLASSNAGAAVNFSAGTKDITNDQPAGKRVDGPTVAIANGGTGATTAAAALTALGGVAKIGDTMTGQLMIQPATGGANLSLAPVQAAQQALVNFYQGGSAKWTIGKNTDDSLIIYNGSTSAIPMRFPILGDEIIFNTFLTVNDNIQISDPTNPSTQGWIYFGTPGSHWIGRENDKIWIGNGGGTTTTQVDNIVSLGTAVKPGGGAWAAPSDERIKTIEGEYTRGLFEVAALRPVYFTYKGNDTAALPKDSKSIPYADSPNKVVASSGQKFAGLIAQEVEAIFPEMVTTREGYINGVAVDDMRDLDTTPLIFALVNSVKELSAQVESLKADLIALREGR